MGEFDDEAYLVQGEGAEEQLAEEMEEEEAKAIPNFVSEEIVREGGRIF